MGRYLAGALCALVLSLGSYQSASAQGLFESISNIFGGGDAESGAGLRATIWVDPDGCEHWVMDDGLEGFMSSHLDRNGKPVCRGALPTNGICKTLDSAATFAVGSATIMPDALGELKAYLMPLGGRTIVINGHTDNTGSVEANLQLSLRRALAVAKVAEEFGVIAEPRGYGEQVPLVSNKTAAGRAKNRRVELTCS